MDLEDSGALFLLMDKITFESVMILFSRHLLVCHLLMRKLTSSLTESRMLEQK